MVFQLMPTLMMITGSCCIQ